MLAMRRRYRLIHHGRRAVAVALLALDAAVWAYAALASLSTLT